MPRLDNILIANRGEIAVRVIRTARALGYRTTAVYSEPDAGAPHVALADHAVLLGGAALSESYLNPARILDAARATKADAIHPGYGLLSENASFARACIEAGLSWIGPPPQVIERLGNKDRARQLARELGLPLVAGYDGDDQSDARLVSEAERIGVPLMVKAAAGGGGRGMRRVASLDALPEALARARSEAKVAFGDERLILERAIEGARHVEVQVVADAHGNVIYLGERECSVQRRFQKLVEEAPSPAVDAALRAQIGAAAVGLARAAGYVGAGTVELLLGPDGQWSFLEVNTRLQVEHPVTELVTGLDLVALQLKIAEGLPLPIAQDDVLMMGCAIEARVCAEDPERDHLPCTGTVLSLALPAAETRVRVDHALRPGLAIGSRYDSLLAKVIAHGPDRESARATLGRALSELRAPGVQTNQAFLQAVLAGPAFARGELTTESIDSGAVMLEPPGPQLEAQVVMLAALAATARDASGREPSELSGFTNALGLAHPIALDLGGKRFELAVEPSREAAVLYLRASGERTRVTLLERSEKHTLALIAGVHQRIEHFWEADDLWLHALGRMWRVRELTRAAARAGEAEASGRAAAPMDGVVIEVSVKAGQRVAVGEALAVIEAMKLERRVQAGLAGVVAAVHVSQGAHVRAGDVLVTIES